MSYCPTDHLQKWLVYGSGLLIFLISAAFWLSETGQICGFRAFSHDVGIANARKMCPAFPVHAQPTILRIWREAHAQWDPQEHFLANFLLSK